GSQQYAASRPAALDGRLDDPDHIARFLRCDGRRRTLLDARAHARIELGPSSALRGHELAPRRFGACRERAPLIARLDTEFRIRWGHSRAQLLLLHVQSRFHVRAARAMYAIA